MNKGKIRIFEGFAGYGGGSFGLKRLKENLPGLEIEVVGYSEFDKFASELFDANHHKADGSPLTNWEILRKLTHMIQSSQTLICSWAVFLVNHSHLPVCKKARMIRMVAV